MQTYSATMESHISKRSVLGMLGSAFAALPVAGFGMSGAVKRVKSRIFDLNVGNGRTSQITHWQAAAPRGTILFSHGALSSPAKYDPLILPWVAAGYDVWAPLHVDSTDHPYTKDFSGLTSWRARIEDMRALSRHIGKHPYIAAGHSYGGLTALTLGGASANNPEGITSPLRDPRAKAVVAFSPPGKAPGLIDGAGYATLAVPAFIQTGDKDIPPPPPGVAVDPDAWRGHLLAYDSTATGGDRFALVLAGVDHYFGGLICRPELPGPKQAAQLAQAVGLSKLFLDGYGLNKRRAKAALLRQLSDSAPVQLFWK